MRTKVKVLYSRCVWGGGRGPTPTGPPEGESEGAGGVDYSGCSNVCVGVISKTVVYGSISVVQYPISTISKVCEFR